jgi:hypothetical protein
VVYFQIHHSVFWTFWRCHWLFWRRLLYLSRKSGCAFWRNWQARWWSCLSHCALRGSRRLNAWWLDWRWYDGRLCHWGFFDNILFCGNRRLKARAVSINLNVKDFFCALEFQVACWFVVVWLLVDFWL